MRNRKSHQPWRNRSSFLPNIPNFLTISARDMCKPRCMYATSVVLLRIPRMRKKQRRPWPERSIAGSDRYLSPNKSLSFQNPHLITPPLH
ncbi:hypothetical protein NPIL_322371 [Nephila pilipes]|uniref:Uncharacterized protein n=1 Tax=Nephila pilipes TaxID=299642 RepID=A0A8X6UJH7_NEPPI|nr:hypothetical protein NPIL_322371 [Nephila pilipes]